MLAALALAALGHIDASHFRLVAAEAPPPAEQAPAAAAPAAAADAPVVEEDGPSSTPVEQMSREQLQAEFDRLEKYRTIFIGPTVMTGVGGLVLIIGGVFVVAGIVYALLPGAIGGMTGTMLSALKIAGFVLMGVGAVAAIAGGIVLAIGLVKLFPALAKRRAAVERRDEIQKQLEKTNPAAPVAPAPVAPGDVLRDGPMPSMVLATF